MKRLIILAYLLCGQLFSLAGAEVCLGSVALVNPIAATIGTGVALATIAQKAYQACVK